MYSYDILIEHDCDGKGQGGLMGGGTLCFVSLTTNGGGRLNSYRVFVHSTKIS